jgi:hypothetical protein
VRGARGADDLRDLAAMVGVVLDQVPDDPCPGDDPDLAVASTPRELHLEVLGRPSTEGLFEQRPRPLEGVGELGGRARMVFVVLPARILERQVRHGGRLDTEHVPDGGVALAEDVVEPVRARAGHVAASCQTVHWNGAVREASCSTVSGRIASRSNFW